MFVTKIIELRAHYAPDATALKTLNRELSYAELCRRYRSVATLLGKLGVQRGSTIGICCRDDIDHVVCALAAMHAGGMFVSMDWRGKADRQYIVDQLSDQMVLVDAQTKSLSGDNLVVMDEAFWQEANRQQESDRVSEACPSDGACVNTTSGSTGAVKGYITTHEYYMARFLQKKFHFPDADYSRYFSCLSFSFGATRNNVMVVLMNGGAIHFYPTLFSAAEIAEYMLNHKITSTMLVPNVAIDLLSLTKPGEILLPDLRYLLLGGGKISAALKLRCLNEISPYTSETYASTGSSLISVALGEDIRRFPDSVGRPVVTSIVEVVDDTGAVCEPMQNGRIRCRGMTVTRGYHPQFSSTDEYETHADGYFYPGDVGHFDKQGYLYLDGRASTRVVRGGVNIYPEQIEQQLMTHPLVSDAVVSAFPDENDEMLVVGYVASETVAPESVMAHLRRTMNPHQLPDRLVQLTDIPKTASGKTNRKSAHDVLTSAMSNKSQ